MSKPRFFPLFFSFKKLTFADCKGQNLPFHLIFSSFQVLRADFYPISVSF